MIAKRTLLLFWVLVAGLSVGAAGDNGCPMERIVPERLPDLNIPRGDPSVFVVGGEPTVVGGHTDGFVPTATAEYFSEGEWHLVSTVYPHDHGFSVPLRSGQVLIGGGHSEPLGIGHIFSVEMYDPATHSCLASAVWTVSTALPQGWSLTAVVSSSPATGITTTTWSASTVRSSLRTSKRCRKRGLVPIYSA